MGLKKISIYFIAIFSLIFCCSWSQNTKDPLAYNLYANHRPRFKIPRGNLSIYNQPHWEVLYFFKHGAFPNFKNPSPNFNRTNFVNKLRRIKSFWDRDSPTAGADQPAPTSTEDYTLPVKNFVHGSIDSTEDTKITISSSTQEDQGPAQDLDVDLLTFFGKPKSNQHGNTLENPLALNLLNSESRKGDGAHHQLVLTRRAGGPNTMYGIPGENNQDRGGFTGDSTVSRKTGRKFQTQGWK